MGASDEIELQIQDNLSSIAQSLNGRPDGECTAKVMTVLEALGSSLGWEVRGCEVRGRSSGTAKHCSEVLFDMTWVRLQNQATLDIELVVESEWDPDGVQYDFQKVMVGRARHRLMIFSKNSKILAQKATDCLIAEIQNFRLTQPDDRYLFAVWHNEGAAFEFRVYVHA